MIFPAVLLLAAPLPLVMATPHKSSNSWACPEYGLDFLGSDITHYENIPSWQECGKESLQIRIDGNTFIKISPPPLNQL